MVKYLRSIFVNRFANRADYPVGHWPRRMRIRQL